MTYQDFNIHIPPGRRSGNIKTRCPRCSATRRNKRDRSLSVNLDDGVWLCHHCGWKGALHNREERDTTPRTFAKPPQVPKSTLPRDMVDWFGRVRGISEDTLQRLWVTAMPYTTDDGSTHHRIVFNYILDGERINYKTRDGAKRFGMFQGGRVIPYNIDAIKGKPTAIITEGEMDCLALTEAGYDNVVSAPTGSNANLSWLDDFIDSHFDDKEQVIIAGDTDEAGRKLRDALVVRLGADRCRLVTSWGDGCKDADDVLMKHGKAALRQCIEAAADIPQDGVFCEADYHDALSDLWRIGLHRGLTLGYENLDKLLSFESRKLMVVTGVPGSGKSEFIDQMCVIMNILHGWRTAYFSPENYPLHLHGAKLIEKVAGTWMRESSMSREQFERTAEYIRDNFYHIMPEVACIDDILDGARWLVRKRGVKIVVIDPYNRIESDQPRDMTETAYISAVLDQLTDFAQRNDCLVILMAHPRKINRDANGDGIPSLYDINGSAHFFNKADYGMVVHRDRQAMHTLVRVAKVRFRHLGECGDAFFRYNERNGRYYPEGGDPDDRDWLIDNPATPVPTKPPQKPYAWRDESDDEDWKFDFTYSGQQAPF